MPNEGTVRLEIHATLSRTLSLLLLLAKALLPTRLHNAVEFVRIAADFTLEIAPVGCIIISIWLH